MAGGGGGERHCHGGQNPFHRVHQHHATIVPSQLFEIPPHGAVHQLDQRAGQLAAGWAGAHHHHGLQKGALLGIGGLFGFLQGHQQPPADFIGVLEDLHRRRQWPPFLTAEIGASRAGGQDQLVVAVMLPVEQHLSRLWIDIHHFAKQDLDIGRIAHHLAQGRGHVGLGHQPRGHLIQQRLE